ncbi:MAG: tyrosine--tRNA ligase [Myxococcota bacterium]|nr:tyrosine--tRNA ligase [Myxococcota bacterium]
MLGLEEQVAELSRGCVSLHSEEELLKRLERSQETGQPLRVKAGFDPTAPDLHLGHTVLLQRMKRFQDLGHTAIFLIGDFTAMIGDPTGRSKTRPPLTLDDVKRNAETYKAQVFKILDPEKTEVRFNSEWFGDMPASELIALASRYPVARMLERDDFDKRYKAGQSIAIHEFLYPLVQAWDSVMLKADVELGGDDQLFNLLLGRTLMKQEMERGSKLPPQIVMTNPLLEGIDAQADGEGVSGAKMSKSLGNAIGVDEPARDQFGKMMRICDPLMWRYYELLSDRSLAEIEQLKAQVADGSVHPKQAKLDLAQEITARFSGAQAGAHERAEFERISHDKDALPDDLPEVQLAAQTDYLGCLVAAGVAKSRGEARRLVQGRGVRIDGEVAEDPFQEIPSGDWVLRVGKRRFFRMIGA